MKTAYKALYHQVLCEKEELLYKVDKLVEKNIKMKTINQQKIQILKRLIEINKIQSSFIKYY